MVNTEYVLVQLINELNAAIDVQDICNDFNSHPEYPSLLSFTETLKKWGINNHASKISFTELNTLQPPFIVCVPGKVTEYVLVSAITADTIELSNKTYRKDSISLKSFEEKYGGDGIVLVIDKKAAAKLKKRRGNKLKAELPGNKPPGIFNTKPLLQRSPTWILVQATGCL
ncbi:cysteine peptidase family C39 domain-containing protein [Mucilaginibacter angelicae]|uniref:Cysteine peptidase family C39 domain-containing protein n=1 Tax=Mucilaginibacter angelicae TaxID=869718 RepID=A0ABV6L1I6_9SPHI